MSETPRNDSLDDLKEKSFYEHGSKNIKWTTLNNDVKKGLLIIMNRATIPIKFTSGNILSMNLDSFVMMLKTSYSLFNVLANSQK